MVLRSNRQASRAECRPPGPRLISGPVSAGRGIRCQTTTVRRAGTAEMASAARHPHDTIAKDSSGGEMAEPSPIDVRTMPVARPCFDPGTQAETPAAAAGYAGAAATPSRNRITMRLASTVPVEAASGPHPPRACARVSTTQAHVAATSTRRAPQRSAITPAGTMLSA